MSDEIVGSEAFRAEADGIVSDLLALAGADERPHLRVLVERVADLQRLDLGLERVHEAGAERIGAVPHDRRRLVPPVPKRTYALEERVRVFNRH